MVEPDTGVCSGGRHAVKRDRERNTVAFVLAGQVLASMILDQFGLLNLPVHSVSLARLGGGALVITGVFVVLRT